MSAMKKPPSQDKQALRKFFIQKRRAMLNDIQRKRALDMEIQSRLIVSPEYRAADTLLLYAARDFEISTSAIMTAAMANNKTVAMPRCGDDGEMSFYRISSYADLLPGRYGIPEPREGCELIEPDDHTLCVCPCLCTDMRGYRLGFGAGYYDRFLTGFPGTCAALCYSDAMIPELVCDDNDIPMKLIVTDSYIRHIY